ncbi:hypothetical protein ADL27_04400 [Streptomyces sp. NRRL F-6602]|nr:hypothetical protein ADL27_04400 [Streptomyces sp. NRRL F-6602]
MPQEGDSAMPENEEPQVEEQPETAQEPGGGSPADPWADPAAARREIERLRKESASYRTKARELEDAQKSEAERLTEQLAAERERAATATRTAVAAKVEALAAKTFADPEDAAGALDLTAYTDEVGAIDTDRIQADLDDLLKRKPHWARPDDNGPRRPAPDRTQGSSGNGSRTPNDPAADFAAFLNRGLSSR